MKTSGFLFWFRLHANYFDHLSNGKPWTEEEIAEVAEAYADNLRSVLDKISDVEGSISVHNGVATFPDGTQIKFAEI